MLSAQVDDQTIDRLDALAMRFSERFGRAVSRSEVVRALIGVGLDKYPVTDEEIESVRSGARTKPPSEPPARPHLRLVDGDAEDVVTPPVVKSVPKPPQPCIFAILPAFEGFAGKRRAS